MGRVPVGVRLVLAAATVMLAGAGLLLAGDQRPRSPTPAYPRSFPEVGITLLDEWVADLDLAHDGKLLAYPRRDPRDWYMEIWTVLLNGQDRRCLTCELLAPSKHKGAVSWHPSGQYLAFAAENEDVRSRKGDRLAEPETGLNTNLWVMAADGSRAWKLTDYDTDATNPRGVVHPQFSPDGRRICWSGPVDRTKAGKGFEWGEWALFIADFEVRGGVPALRAVRSLQPGEQHAYYEADDWSADGRHLLVSANLRPGQPVSGQDIYELDVDSGAMRPLMRTDAEWDEFAHYTPDGRHIVWVSSRGLGVRFRSLDELVWRRDLKTELWMVNRDGSGPRRLTFFNEPGWRDHAWFQEHISAARRVIVSDNAVLPDGARAVVSLGYEPRPGQLNSVLAVLDLERRRSMTSGPAAPAIGR